MNKALEPHEWSKKYTVCAYCWTNDHKYYCHASCVKCRRKLRLFENYWHNAKTRIQEEYMKEKVEVKPINIQELLDKVKEREQKGLHNLVMMIDWEEYRFPFSGLPKKQLKEEDKQIMREFEALKAFYEFTFKKDEK